jgi:hypothetical protein
MKRVLAGVSMLMLGAAVSVGCGGSQDAQGETPQTQASAQTPAPADSSTASEAPPPWTQGQTGAEKKVGELGACCYVKCSKWHGPFPGVAWDNCTNYGRYYCAQQGGGAFSDARWDNC